MYDLADALVAVPLFARVAAREVRASAELWMQRTLVPGDDLWTEGDGADGVAVLVRGELVVMAEGTALGRVVAGELVGEVSAFLGEPRRTATLRASRDATALCLPGAGLRYLRERRSGVYAALLSRALVTLTRRVRATDGRVGALADGELPAPTRAESSAMARLWRALRPGAPKSPCPPLAPLLRGLTPLLDGDPGLSDGNRDVLVAALRPTPIEEGGVLFLEGDPGGAAWIIAEGEIDILRQARGGRADLVTTLHAGDLLGVNALVDGLPRSATAVARSAGWMYRLDPDSYAALPGGARLVWDECLLASLIAQISRADVALRQCVEATGDVAPLPGSPPPRVHL